MVGQQFANLEHLEEFGANLKGNVKAGLKVTPLDFAASEQKRAQLFQRFAKFFERYDLLITPQSPVKQFPVEMNFPTLINGKKLDNYTDWIAGSFLITLMSLPGGSVPAGQTADGLPVGIQIVGPRFEEPLILSVMKIVQQLHPWAGRLTPEQRRCARQNRQARSADVRAASRARWRLPLRPSRA